MTRALYGHTITVAAFVAAFNGAEFGNCQAIGFLDRKGTLEAGVVYHDWNPEKETIEISLAGTGRWLTRSRLRLILAYPFEQIGCRLVYGRTENPIVIRACRLLGGTVTEIPGLTTFVTLTAEQWSAHARTKSPHAA